MENSRLVVKDNALIDAAFNLSLVEQRILLLAIVEAREIEGLTSSTAIEVTAAAYSEQYNLGIDKAYQTLKDACDTLFERRFSYIDKYKGDQLIKKVRWVSEIGYVENKGLILLNLSDTVISLISRLSEQFTKYHLNQVSMFKSKYSIRIYELVIKWLVNGSTQKYEVDDLREKLGIANNEYKTMSLFKVNVLDKAVIEINSKSDLNISYQQFKAGRIITHIQFKLKQKENAKKDQKEKKIIYQLTKKQIEMFSERLSKLEKFQQHFQADIGQSIEAYKAKIASKLKDEFYVNAWRQYLEEVGFKKS